MKLKGIKIVKEYCPQNHPCPSKSICPVGAIKQKGFGAPTIDEEKCILCGKCLNTCPVFQPIPA
ncbi:4Fe-4S binding protein [Halothermothrix orenii]|uniref:4Fe-4S ferredoxin iron-sulfur binding domain protein n=1 Tax=Halothermothrix orenii (strain H 168 / OCM 544 / DSM 9562) TaxID=373903 RepID=B8CZQ7_HALOH|nr:4Fe-4S binding protein [Halothermothrix orenii]ACL70759.1 4Fe-4S ferredoxin iron-sulfur binding domain protein [Halothermothrix orenii H 168]